MQIAVLPEIRVIYVVAENGPEGAKKAFDKLEKHLTTLMAATNTEDKSRPRIEFYRSMKELFLLLPISDE